MNKTQRDELQASLSEINSLLDGLQENFASLGRVLSSLEVSERAVAPAPKKRGRPKKVQPAMQTLELEQPIPLAGPRKDDPAVEDMLGLGRTDPALAERLKNRYRPFPRGTTSLGPGVKVESVADIKKRQKAPQQSPGHVSIEDE